MLVLNVDTFLDYTQWEREKWQGWFHQHGADVLNISAGLHGDGRFQTIGEVVRHIFSAEKRYFERLTGRALTDTTSIPTDNVESLFEFGKQCRHDLQQYIETFPSQDWDIAQEYSFMNMTMKLSPRKIILQVLTHEIRHWAQIATLLRLQGLKGDSHDFLFSPVLGDEIRKQEAKP
jgi:uncharacterized damage-inducible protein DinB